MGIHPFILPIYGIFTFILIKCSGAYYITGKLNESKWGLSNNEGQSLFRAFQGMR